MSKKKIIGFLKKQWILVWLVTASFLMMVVVVYAAYKDVNTKIRRVIAPTAKITELFTSNFLVSGSDNRRTAYFSSNNTNTYPFDVDIRNYDPSDPGMFYKAGITYTLTAQLVHKDDNATPYDPTNNTDDNNALNAYANWNINIAPPSGESFNLNSSNLTATKTDTLSSTVADSHSWRVTFNGIPLGKDFCLKLTATPTVINNNVKTLIAIIDIASTPTLITPGWEGRISETSSFSDYDGFNYTITGTGAKTLKFSYDPSVLTVNPSFCSFNTEVNEAGYSGTTNGRSGWRTITINADPDRAVNPTPNRYDFQLYKNVNANYYNSEAQNYIGDFVALSAYYEFDAS